MADESQILSQSEVEAILQSIGKTEEEVVTVLSNRPRRGTNKPSISAYDFRSPTFLTAAQMRRLRIKHEEFIRGLAASASMALRMEFSLQMARLETMAYQHMKEALPVPSHITIFKLKPLAGLCLFNIAPRLGLTVIDRMLGGPGHGVKVEREFTDIEKVVLQNFLELIIREYTNSWLKYQTLEYEMVESENSAKFLNIVPADEVMLYLEMEARFGDCVASLQFMIPFRAIEGIVGRMMAEIMPEDENKGVAARMPEDPRAPLYHIPVPVSLHWRGFTASLTELQHLEPGDVIMLDPSQCEVAQVDLGSVPTFTARVDRKGGRLSASILGKVK